MKQRILYVCDICHKEYVSNGAYQIMKKVFPKVNADGIQGVALHPIRVSVA